MNRPLRYTGGKALLAVCALLLSTQCLCRAQSPASTDVSSASAPGGASGYGKAVLPTDQAQQVYVQTLASYLESHDQAAAEGGFLKAIQIDSSYAPAWFNLGVFAEANKNWLKAEDYFQHYLQVAPNGQDAGRAQDQLQILAKYESGTINQAAEKKAQYDAMIQRSRSFLAVKLFREAVAEAGRAQAADDSRWEAYAVVCLAMVQQNRAGEAITFRDMALARTPPELTSKVSEALSAPER